MRIVGALVFIAVCFLFWIAREAAPNTSRQLSLWAGRASDYVVHKVEDGTGINLNPADIKWEYGDARPGPDGHGKARDCKIVINYRNSHLETVVEGLPCDRDGVPMDVASKHVNDAVERIKERLREASRNR